MTCSKCACEVAETAKFCRRCGTKVPQKVPEPQSVTAFIQASLTQAGPAGKNSSPTPVPLGRPAAAAANDPTMTIVRAPSAEPPRLAPLQPPSSAPPSFPAAPAISSEIPRPPSGPPPALKSYASPAAIAPERQIAQNSPRRKFILAGVIAVFAIVAGAFFLRSSGGQSADDRSVFLTMDGSADKGVQIGVVDQGGSQLYSATVRKDMKDADAKAMFVPADMTGAADWGIKLATQTGRIMLIDRFGKKTIDPPGIPSSDFVNGLAPATLVNDKQKCGYMDRDHKMRIAAEYSWCAPFSDGLAVVQSGGKVGYVTRTGTLQIPLRYNAACPLTEGFTRVNLDGKWQVINAQGATQFPSEFAQCVAISEGLVVDAQHGLIGFRNTSGQWVIPAKYDGDVTIFRDNRALVTSHRTVSLIDKSGAEIPIPAISAFRFFEHGLAPVSLNGKWGLMDTQGRMVVEAKYEEMGELISGLRSAGTRGVGYTFFDERGMEVKPPTPLCTSYRHGVFTCVKNSNGSTKIDLLAILGRAVNLDYYTRSGQRIGGMEFNAL